MADATGVTAVVARELEYYLGYVEQRFAELEDRAAEGATLSAEDRNDFLFDWPVVEDAVRALRSLVHGAGTIEPYGLRYRRLDERITKDGAVVQAMRRM